MSGELTDAQQASQPDSASSSARDRTPCATLGPPGTHASRGGLAACAKGYLGALTPPEQGGTYRDMVTFGLLNEELGRGCSSVRSLLTVHGMVQYAILRWGSETLKAKWLPRLANGEAIGAFGLTEPGTRQRCQVDRGQGPGRPAGRTCWTASRSGPPSGRCRRLPDLRPAGGADLHLPGGARSPGVRGHPHDRGPGDSASMLARLRLESCEIPKENRVGGVGFGLGAVGLRRARHRGYSVACGSVGIAQACLDASIDYASRRKQYGALLKDHQLIRKMITEMVVNVAAAHCLCLRAGRLKDAGDPRTVVETLMAKYFASKAAVQAASDAVQIHGANGFGTDYPVQRYFRDFKVTEIIEGSSQILEITIAKEACETNGSLAWRRFTGPRDRAGGRRPVR